MDPNIELTTYFWGRILPKEFEYVNNLSPWRMSVEDLEKLEKLKLIIETSEELGIELPFGQQQRFKDLIHQEPEKEKNYE